MLDRERAASMADEGGVSAAHAELREALRPRPTEGLTIPLPGVRRVGLRRWALLAAASLLGVLLLRALRS